MIGQLVFAELPFACFGQPPYIERGWINDCANKNEWDKQPVATSSWQAIDRAVNGWDKQPTNDLNTIGCGDFKPSNIPEIPNGFQ
jgi:hypothetical protein